MIKVRRVIPILAALVLGAALAGAAEQRSVLDRILGRHSADVTEDAQPKQLVEPHPDAVALQDSFAKVAEAVKPAVVNISAVQITRVDDNAQQFYFGSPDEFFYRFFGEPGPSQRQQMQHPREMRQEAMGSGVIIDPSGLILTNNHVVQDASQLTVTTADGKSYKGKVIGTDPRTDLALVRIKSGKPFASVPLGDSSKMRIGDWVLAVGSPFGLEQTVTAGIVSAIRQSLMIEGRNFRNLLQTDAAINRGNSGGPLVNIRGQVIGINTAIYAPTGVFAGIGFAIPVNDAKSVIKELMEKGYVERSWMGVEIAEVDDVIAHQFGLGEKRGALVNQVLPNSPASKAGLERGDVIVEFNGKKVNSIQELQDTVSETPPGRTVKLTAIREGNERTFTLKTERMPKQEESGADGQQQGEDEDDSGAPAEKTTQWLGAAFATLTPRLRQNYDVPDDVTGVVLVEVPPASVAADAGLQEGDVLRGVNQKPLKSIADLTRLKDRLDPKKGVVFDLVRGGRSFYLTYKSVQ